ncbi:MAG: transporter associated domain-containing protein, partial [Anaerolineae bacterium]
FISSHEYIFDARVDLDDLNRLMGVGLPTDDSDTLGGFIYTELGKVPVVGNQLTYQEMRFTVESVAGRRIKKVRVERLLPPEEEKWQADEPAKLLKNGRNHENGNGG